jgi:hypothetical protein
VNVTINPQSRLFFIRTRGEAGDTQQPDVTPFVTLANTFYTYKLRELLSVSVQDTSQVFVTVEFIEPNIWHNNPHEHLLPIMYYINHLSVAISGYLSTLGEF